MIAYDASLWHYLYFHVGSGKNNTEYYDYYFDCSEHWDNCVTVKEFDILVFLLGICCDLGRPAWLAATCCSASFSLSKRWGFLSSVSEKVNNFSLVSLYMYCIQCISLSHHSTMSIMYSNVLLWCHFKNFFALFWRQKTSTSFSVLCSLLLLQLPTHLGCGLILSSCDNLQ